MDCLPIHACHMHGMPHAKTFNGTNHFIKSPKTIKCEFSRSTVCHYMVVARVVYTRQANYLYMLPLKQLQAGVVSLHSMHWFCD